MTKEDGGTAFPRDDRHTGTPGMTLRDWFAGQALQGFVGWMKDDQDANEVARRSFAFADAMLKERER